MLRLLSRLCLLQTVLTQRESNIQTRQQQLTSQVRQRHHQTTEWLPWHIFCRLCCATLDTHPVAAWPIQACPWSMTPMACAVMSWHDRTSIVAASALNEALLAKCSLLHHVSCAVC